MFTRFLIQYYESMSYNIQTNNTVVQIRVHFASYGRSIMRRQQFTLNGSLIICGTILKTIETSKELIEGSLFMNELDSECALFVASLITKHVQEP